MRDLVYFIATTLDGYIAGPDGSDPSGPDGFWPITSDYVSFLASTYPETLPAAARTALSITDAGTHFDTALQGRRTYDIGVRAGVTNAYPHLRSIVFSRTLGETEDGSVEVIDSDPVATVRALKQASGLDVWLVGGGDLAGALYEEIDRLIIKLGPLTIGRGIPLFSSKASFNPQHWDLVDHHRLDGGVVVLDYLRRRSASP